MGGVTGGSPKKQADDILSDVDALHKTTSEPGPYLAGMTEIFEMARRMGFAKAEIREALEFLADISGGRCGEPNAATHWAERACHRALKMLETGKAE